jgi:RNA polymerase sigma factor (sigma-70 family)
MSEQQWLAERFEEHRTHLRSVAYRMLGSSAEADDAVQEAWLRLHGSTASSISNLGGWMTTTLARICLDMLRSRSARREVPADVLTEGSAADPDGTLDPEQEALLADSLGVALLTVLDAMAPAERVAFVLHDLFHVPFDEIAGIVARSPEATRKLASRARRKLAGSTTARTDRRRQDEIVRAFLNASRHGDLGSLIELLDPDAALRPDRVAEESGAPRAQGANAVAQAFTGRARGARIALVDGLAGLAWAPGGQLRGVFQFSVHHDKITAIDLIADPEALAQLDVIPEPAKGS